MNKTMFLLFAAATLTSTQTAAQKTFTYSDIAAGRFNQKTVNGVMPMADGERYTALTDGAVEVYAYGTGEREATFCNPQKLGVEAERISGYQLSADENKIMFSVDSKPLYRHSAYSTYFVYDIAKDKSTLLAAGDSIRYAVFAPNGEKAAYVEGNNIFVKGFSNGKTTQVTRDGKFNHIINGMPDWVYEEEWGISDALCWSPDGNKIAFLRFDEKDVKEYSIDFYGTGEGRESDGLAAPIYPREFTYKYPVAGESNSVVSLHVYDMHIGKTVKVDTGVDTDQYVPFFGWTPSGELYFMRINRRQNHLEVFLADAKGCITKIYDETSDKYIDNISMETVTFLDGGDKFIVKNETRTGFSHLYMYGVKEGFLYPITSGEWEVKNIVNAADDKVWFISNETSPLRNNLYVVGTDGQNKTRLTDGEGIYRIAPSAGCKYYVSYFSNSSTPNTVTLHSGDGKMIRTLEDNAELKKYIAEVNYPVKEFSSFTVERDGEPVELNYYIVHPSDFDPAKKYPVLLTQYSGPVSQQVLDRWFVDWEDALVQEGYIVLCMDPRGTGGRGEHFKKLTYGKLGLLETEDQIDFGRYAASLQFVDPQRIGIYGWSYGGFMSLNCILKGSDVFRTAISVAPVTSWRYYDSVYTERFNGLPQDNSQGYDLPSPIYYADKLRGKLLLMHGSADDNVHPQNSFKMAHELVKAGKKFDMMIYTDDNHSMMPYGRYNVRQKMVDYCLENL